MKLHGARREDGTETKCGLGCSIELLLYPSILLVFIDIPLARAGFSWLGCSPRLAVPHAQRCASLGTRKVCEKFASVSYFFLGHVAINLIMGDKHSLEYI